jgi:hypothetical protein
MTNVPPTDSPDYDASVGVGGQILVNDTNVVNPGLGYASSTLYVGNAPAMFVQFSAGNSSLTQVLITWFAAPGGMQIAQTSYLFNQSGAQPIADLVVNKAPFMQISATNLGGAAIVLAVFASSAETNAGSLSFFNTRTLVSIANQVVAAGGQFIQNMFSNVPGAAVWWVNSSPVGSVFFTLEEANILGGWTQFAQLDFNAAASFSQFQQVSMDNSNFRLRVNNFTGGNATVQSSLITLR